MFDSHPLNVLVVGFGSIGQRHARNFANRGHKVSIVSQHVATESNYPVVRRIQDLSSEEFFEFDLVLVCNKTTDHFTSLEQIADLGFKGSVLVEKPLFDRLYRRVIWPFRSIGVLYNLRFHPLVQRLKSALQAKEIVSVQAYVGQYLPEWRPGADYRQSYSASRKEGGGALRDLSHEIDYLLWLCGKPIHLTGHGGHFSSLEIDSDDCFSLLMETERCPQVGLNVNYLDRIVQRHVTVHTDHETYKADFINQTFQVNDQIQTYQLDGNFTYEAVVDAAESGNAESFCSLEEALKVIQVVELAEQASRERNWVRCTSMALPFTVDSMDLNL